MGKERDELGKPVALEEKKAKTKNQHYVPQFYQRFFSSDGKMTGAYVLEQKKIISAAPIKIRQVATISIRLI